LPLSLFYFLFFIFFFFFYILFTFLFFCFFSSLFSPSLSVQREVTYLIEDDADSRFPFGIDRVRLTAHARCFCLKLASGEKKHVFAQQPFCWGTLLCMRLPFGLCINAIASEFFSESELRERRVLQGSRGFCHVVVLIVIWFREEKKTSTCLPLHFDLLDTRLLPIISNDRSWMELPPFVLVEAFDMSHRTRLRNPSPI
jgi:hypothetical protein